MQGEGEQEEAGRCFACGKKIEAEPFGLGFTDEEISVDVWCSRECFLVSHDMGDAP